MTRLFVASRQKRVCFSNPLNGRLWLDLLEPHRRFGLLFRRSLNYPKQVLGFSFSSNQHGLRGPANRLAPGVVLGTSFGMGLSVDDGSNWYDLLLDPDEWFNGSMPVGPQNHANLLDELYQGSYAALLYLYHPNLWTIARGYVRADELGQDIFQTLSWKTGIWGALSLYPRWIAKEIRNAHKGWSVHNRWNGQTYFFNARYSYMDLTANLGFAEAQVALLNGIFGRFKSVVVVRVPVKEDLAGRHGVSQRLRELAAQYDEWWNFFLSKAIAPVRAVELPWDQFEPSDFHPYDTHWTAGGNRRFAELMRPILIEARFNGVKPS